MFGIGSTELLVILLVALIVLGPRSLAGFSSKLGRLVGEFRRVSTDFQRTLNLEAAQEEAREAQKKRAQASASARTDEKGAEDKSASTQPDPGPEDLRLHGIPDDSPLAQALKRAREQAESVKSESVKNEEAKMGEVEKGAAKEAAKQEENDIRA